MKKKYQEVEFSRSVLKVIELNNRYEERPYREGLCENCEVLRVWRRCGKSSEISVGLYQRRVCHVTRKGNELWSGAVCVQWLKREESLRNDSREEMGIRIKWYRTQRAVVKQAVTDAKIIADWRWGEGMLNEYVGKKCLGKR